MDKNTMDRLKKYITERKKSRGLDHEHIHGMNCGDVEREAILLLSDIQNVCNEITHLQAEVENLTQERDRLAKDALTALAGVVRDCQFTR